MKWEYKSLKVVARTEGGASLTFSVTREAGEFDEAGLVVQMNRLGQEGWELVAALDTGALAGSIRVLVLLFKRSMDA